MEKDAQRRFLNRLGEPITGRPSRFYIYKENDDKTAIHFLI